MHRRLTTSKSEAKSLHKISSKKQGLYKIKVPIAFRQWEQILWLRIYGVAVAVGVALAGAGVFVTVGVALLAAVVDVAVGAGADELL